jgi:hypothetical protein
VSLDKDLGRLSGLVEGLQSDMTEVKADVKALLAEKHQRRGGWKVVAGISTVVAAAIAAVMDLIRH